MITIEHAILHSMDGGSQQYYLSSEEMVLNVPICEYLIRHIEKAKNLNNAQEAIFKITSKLYQELKEYQEDQFVTFTKTIANRFFTAYIEIQKFLDMNLLMVQYKEEDLSYFALLQFKNKQGYTRSIHRENGIIYNEIVTDSSFIPSLSQNIDEFFIICLSDFHILLKENKSYLNKEEEFLISDQILFCDMEMSVKESIQTLHHIVAKVSDELDGNELENTLRLKRFIKSCAESDHRIDVQDIGTVVFPEDYQFQEKFATMAFESHLPKVITMNKKAPANIRKHKIKMDSGIEISIPVEFADCKEIFEIIENSDGTVSILLNHAGKIVE